MAAAFIALIVYQRQYDYATKLENIQLIYSSFGTAYLFESVFGAAVLIMGTLFGVFLAKEYPTLIKQMQQLEQRFITASTKFSYWLNN
jgi:hypothetical protein